jgi:hypothetical protein
MRSASSAAGNAATTAANTGAGLGASASGISSTLTPFLTSELEHPQGYSQGDTSAMLSSALGGAGGATAGIVGQANQEAAASRNAGGFQAVLDDAARARSKAAAGASEGIAAQNADLKQQQQQDASKQLQGMYGTDTSGMLQATGQEAPDINAEVNANNSGWLQQATGVLSALGGAAGGAGSILQGINGKGCWIAAEVYNGWLDPRTVLVRDWIFDEFTKSLFGRVVASLYLKFGEQLANKISKHPFLRKPFKTLFDCALRKAAA